MEKNISHIYGIWYMNGLNLYLKIKIKSILLFVEQLKVVTEDTESSVFLLFDSMHNLKL